MFDLRSLRIVTTRSGAESNFGFVGVRRNATSKEYEFWLPHGLEDYPTDDYSHIVRLFFRLYQAFRIYERRNSLGSNRGVDRDPLGRADEGYTFTYSDAAPPVSFSKLRYIDAVMDSIDELEVATLFARLAMRPPEKLANIHRYLDRAVFQRDHTFFLDSMPLPRQQVEYAETDLVKLFCYLYAEILRWTSDEEDWPPALISAADSFREEFLPGASGLFEPDTFETTLSILRDALELIHRNVTYKDEDYWAMYEACAAFLFGDFPDDDNEDGTLFGVRDFSGVWEDMAHVYLAKSLIPRGREVVFADSPRHNIAEKFRVSVSACLQMRSDKAVRQMAPDLVLLSNSWDVNAADFNHDIEIREWPDRVQCMTRVNNKRAEKLLEKVGRRISKAKGGFRVRRQGKGLSVNMSIAHFWKIIEDEIIKHGPNRTEIYVVDIKYHPLSDFLGSSRLSEKVRGDVLKQKIYELGLSNWLETTNELGQADIRSQFAIPCYKRSNLSDYMPWFIENNTNEKLHKHIEAAKIEICSLPFERVLDAYVRHG